MKTPEGFDLVYLQSETALDGYWDSIRLMLETAISHLEETRPFCAGVSNYFAAVLPDVDQVHASSWISEALECIHREQPMPRPVAEPLLDHLRKALDVMGRTTAASVKSREREIIEAPRDLLKRPVQPSQLLEAKLDWNLAKAFRLRTRPPGRPGRYAPRSLGLEYDRILAFGAGRVDAAKILAHRFGCPWRRIYRLLEGREMIIRDHEWKLRIGTKETLPKKAFRSRRLPYMPYYQAKLTVAVERRVGNRFRPRSDDFDQVAADFSLSVPGEFCGRDVVRNAYEACKEAESGWAKFALAVAGAEPRTVVPYWPWNPADPPTYEPMPDFGPNSEAEEAEFSDYVLSLSREAPCDGPISFIFSSSPQSTAILATAEDLNLEPKTLRSACQWRKIAERLLDRLIVAA
ncbi:MAG: hypothetical protein AAGC60_05600 [Acidobacteriota bacterium]